MTTLPSRHGRKTMTETNCRGTAPARRRRRAAGILFPALPRRHKRESAETLSPGILERQKSLELSTSTLAILRPHISPLIIAVVSC